MRRDNVAIARELLEDGEFGDGGALRADDSSIDAGAYAYLMGVVLLTEPTRAVVRRGKGLNGNLKWHIEDLIRLMPIAWKYETADKAASCIRATCVRIGIVANYYREIKA